MTNTIAVIDCGTNTFHLLIVSITDGIPSILVKEKTVVKIGEGGINNKIITEAAQLRALDALKAFKLKTETHNVGKIYAFATSAFRNATNGEELKDTIKNETDISLNIISGDREAELIFHGVISALDIGDAPALVMDIGGGSVEFILGTSKEVLWKRSFEIGAQRLLDLFHHTEPISPEDLSKLDKYLREQLSELIENIKAHKPINIIGSSGTFDTLSDIYCEKEGITHGENDPEVPMNIKAFKSTYNELLSKDREQRLAIPGMIPMRVDMIVVASALINFLLELHDFQNMRVSTYALKEGVLDSILKGQL